MTGKNRINNWMTLTEQLKSLLDQKEDMIANLANAAALLYHNLDQVNWVGFYLLKERELVLGPFQGLPACIRINIGKGVCGNAALDKKTYRVGDVHQFSGHIACDPASRSEIVVPLIKKDKLLGVLDIDSPVKERFDEIDQEHLENIVKIIIKDTQFML